MNRFIVTFLIGIFLFVNVALGCTLGVKGISRFDDSEYVFIGEIAGYTSSLQGKGLRGDAFGLLIQPREIVHLPKKPKLHFEVFPILLWADCSLSGTSLDKLKIDFRVGTEVRVIAKESSILPRSKNDALVRLEDRPGELGSITVNVDEKGMRMTSAESIFDYRTYSFNIDEDSDSKYLLPSFEIRKDLYRLAKSRSASERTQILERLLYVPIGSDISMYDVLKRHARNKEEFQDFYYKRLLEIEGLSDEEYEFMKKRIPKKYLVKYKNRG